MTLQASCKSAMKPKCLHTRVQMPRVWGMLRCLVASTTAQHAPGACDSTLLWQACLAALHLRDHVDSLPHAPRAHRAGEQLGLLVQREQHARPHCSTCQQSCNTQIRGTT